MNLAQMRTLVKEAEEVIAGYAAHNEAFDKQRESARDGMVVVELGQMAPMFWMAFEFKFLSEVHTIVLNDSGDVIGRSVGVTARR